MPGVLPDLFEGNQLVVLGKYQGEAPLAFHLQGRCHGRPRTFRFSFTLDHATTKNGFVPRLWASRKIATLIAEVRDKGADASPAALAIRAKSDSRMKELVDEIVRLSVEFGILTEYTAFIERQGTDLSARNEVLQQATRNVVENAQGNRTGMGSVTQMMNGNAAISQSYSNARNAYVDQNMARVETSLVQQIGNGAFFQRGNTWIDSSVVNGGSIGRTDQVIQVGTPEFAEVVRQLVTEQRQGALTRPGSRPCCADRPSGPSISAASRFPGDGSTWQDGKSCSTTGARGGFRARGRAAPLPGHPWRPRHCQGGDPRQRLADQSQGTPHAHDRHARCAPAGETAR